MRVGLPTSREITQAPAAAPELDIDCPFCGGHSSHVEDETRGVDLLTGPHRMVVTCKSCGARGPTGRGDSPEEAEKTAIARWRDRSKT